MCVDAVTLTSPTSIEMWFVSTGSSRLSPSIIGVIVAMLYITGDQVLQVVMTLLLPSFCDTKDCY